jgi:hypothetical protein
MTTARADGSQQPKKEWAISALGATSSPTAAVSRRAGHKPMPPLKAIRAKCYDCSYFQLNEIRLCETVNCAVWSFRAGKHPWRVEARKPPLTDANSDQQTAFEDEGLPSC